jgi:hypothetical protein
MLVSRRCHSPACNVSVENQTGDSVASVGTKPVTCQAT